MSKQISWRELERSSDSIKKAEVLKIPLNMIQVKPGFNPRDSSKPETRGKVLAIKESYKAGRYVPPIECSLENGIVYVVDGHGRLEAAMMANDELLASGGLGIESLVVVPFRGNDADRLVLTVTANEGEKLIPIEAAEVVSRLINMGWDRPKIASTFTYSSGWVDKLLQMAAMPELIKQMVRHGKVSTDVAVAAFKKYGEEAIDYLNGLLEGETEKVTTKKVSAKKPKEKDDKFLQEVFAKATEVIADTGFDKTDYNPKKLAIDEDHEVVIKGAALKALIELQEMFRKRAIKEEKARAAAEVAASAEDQQDEEEGEAEE